MVDQLVAESKRGLSLVESSVLESAQFTPAELQEARKYIDGHPDSTSYHLLFALRRQAPEVYKQVADATKTAILCAALGRVTYLNDWGYLDPSESHDGEATKALLETKAAAVNPLKPLLDDRHEAPLFGSEDATLSTMYKYRRADFAYRYLCLALGRRPSFDADPKERDKEIESLKKELAKRP